MCRSPRRVPAGWRSANRSRLRLVQLDRIAVGVGDLHLLSPWTDADVGPERNARRVQTVDLGVELVDIQPAPVPPARCLLFAARRPRPRAGRAAQKEIQGPTRDDRDRPGARLEPEVELTGVE